MSLKLYTKTGDKGETGLLSGQRVLKSHPLIDLYGEVDGLNSAIGLALSLSNSNHEAVTKTLYNVQNRLFDLGSLLACTSDKWESFKLPGISIDAIAELETAIDQLDQELTPLKNFIIPGGSAGASALHVCRTDCRRIERRFVALNDEGETLPENSIQFLNRLSDFLFICARFVNKEQGVADVLWEAKK